MGHGLSRIEFKCTKGHPDCSGVGAVKIVWRMGEREKSEHEAYVEVNMRILNRSTGLSFVEEDPPQDINTRAKETGQSHSWKDNVIKAVKTPNWSFCPHMHTSHMSTEKWVRELLDSIPGHRMHNRRWPLWNSLAQGLLLWPFHKCSAKNCDTRVTLMRELSVDWEGYRKQSEDRRRTFWVLKVERRLGTMRSADDPTWVAQIVDASGLEEDHIFTCKSSGL